MKKGYNKLHHKMLVMLKRRLLNQKRVKLAQVINVEAKGEENILQEG